MRHSQLMRWVAAAVVLLAAAPRASEAAEPMPHFPPAPRGLEESEGADVLHSLPHELPALQEASLLEVGGELDLSRFDALLESTLALPSEAALAAALPQTAPLASSPEASLAIEVPDPSTFLKDDVFLQQLEQQEARAQAQAEAALQAEQEHEAQRHTHDISSKSARSQHKVGRKASMVAQKRKNHAGDVSRSKALATSSKSASSTSSIGSGRFDPQLYDMGKKQSPRAMLKALAGARPEDEKLRDRSRAGRHASHLFPAHNRPSLRHRFPNHDQAPHQQVVNRRHRSSSGHFERNQSFKDNHMVSRHTQNAGFPHHSGHHERDYNRNHPARRQQLQHASKIASHKKSSSHSAIHADKLFPHTRNLDKLNRESQARQQLNQQHQAHSSKSRISGAKFRTQQSERKLNNQQHNHKRSKHHVLLQLQQTSHHRPRFAQLFSHLQTGESVQARGRAGVGAGAGAGARAQKQKRAQQAPPSKFASGFEHVNEQRLDMRSEVDKLKDVEYAASKAKADVERLKAVYTERQKVIDAHRDAGWQKTANLYTMYGASNGIFDRLAASGVEAGERRGSSAASAHTPSRHIVPQRLQRLEDRRVAERRHAWARGQMPQRYHGQLHGKNVGVGDGLKASFSGDASFLQMNERHFQAQRDAPRLRGLPTQ